MPGVIARADRGGQRLAVRVGSGEPAEIAAFAEAHAGDEEAHREGLGRPWAPARARKKEASSTSAQAARSGCGSLASPDSLKRRESIDGEAVEHADAMRARQGFLAAAARSMGRVPRSVAAAVAVGKPIWALGLPLPRIFPFAVPLRSLLVQLLQV